MSPKTFGYSVALLLGAAAVLHAVRFVRGWDAVVAGWAVPLWLSGVLVLVAGFLAVQGFMMARK